MLRVGPKKYPRTFIYSNPQGTKLYRQVVGIPMGTNCAPLIADLFLFCYERDFMMSLSDNKQADVIVAFNTTSRYLDDILNIEIWLVKYTLQSSN